MLKITESWPSEMNQTKVADGNKTASKWQEMPQKSSAPNQHGTYKKKKKKRTIEYLHEEPKSMCTCGTDLQRAHSTDARSLQRSRSWLQAGITTPAPRAELQRTSTWIRNELQAPNNNFLELEISRGSFVLSGSRTRLGFALESTAYAAIYVHFSLRGRLSLHTQML